MTPHLVTNLYGHSHVYVGASGSQGRLDRDDRAVGAEGHPVDADARYLTRRSSR
jgi:hypothetical protein